MNKSSNSLNGKTVFITGASSGIGAALTEQLAQAGARVLMVARRAELLSELANKIRVHGYEVLWREGDLADETERLRIYDWVVQICSVPDILINNAGLGWYGYFEDMSWETARAILRVNVECAAHFTYLFLRGMKARGSGHIINIGSISGSLPSQGIAMYGTSKSFLDAFTTSLYRETRGSGVQVSVLRAGAVKTPFYGSGSGNAGGFALPTVGRGVSPKAVGLAVQRLIRCPRRVMYLPSILSVVPPFNYIFGWLIDRVGPLLLKRKTREG